MGDEGRRWWGSGNRLASRLVVAIPGIGAALALVVVGGAAFVAAAALIATLALFELYHLTAAARPLRWAGYLGGLAVIVLPHVQDDAERGLLLGLLASVALAAVGGLVLPRREEVTLRIAVTVLGVAYVAAPLALLTLLRDLPDGIGAVLNILVGTWAFDTAAYFGGRTWGRRPIAPRTSPGKTVEGTVVGFVVGTLAVWIAGLYMDWISGVESLLLGICVCAAAYLGDLTESLLKRDARAKDSGRLLLGHGGVLDRFDALLFSAPAGYFVTVALLG